MTRQRKVILEELCKVRSHPTADQIYEMVRRKLPHISLATVYRNLDVLSEAGSILKLEMGGSQRRYDGDTSDHCHARCTQCGAIADLPALPVSVPKVPEMQAKGFSIQGHRLEFFGLCPSCQESRPQALAQA
ncbi:MAG: transcriptional repressor [Thermodesulfobacteriota bacterium]